MIFAFVICFDDMGTFKYFVLPKALKTTVTSLAAGSGGRRASDGAPGAMVLSRARGGGRGNELREVGGGFPSAVS